MLRNLHNENGHRGKVYKGGSKILVTRPLGNRKAVYKETLQDRREIIEVIARAAARAGARNKKSLLDSFKDIKDNSGKA